MRRYVFSLPLRLNHAQHGAGAYLGNQDAARPVRSFVWPSCNSTWNRKRRFLPCCSRTMRSRTWAWSNYEVFYQQGRSKIFISPVENLRIETSRSVVQTVLYLESLLSFSLSLSLSLSSFLLLKNTLEESENLFLRFQINFFILLLFSNCFKIINSKNFWLC